jgi:hypothetical protein
MTQSKDYDIDKRFAELRIDVLGQRFTDSVRVNEQLPELPDGITVYVEHIDAIDLKQQAKGANKYPSVEGECPECGCKSLFVGQGGYVTCSRIGCDDPSAPSKALGVTFDSGGSE